MDLAVTGKLEFASSLAQMGRLLGFLNGCGLGADTVGAIFATTAGGGKRPRSRSTKFSRNASEATGNPAQRRSRRGSPRSLGNRLIPHWREGGRWDSDELGAHLWRQVESQHGHGARLQFASLFPSTSPASENQDIGVFGHSVSRPK